jgi:CCR4-NOT transcription complex subunit 3
LIQVEAFDSEIESLQSSVKRKQKPPPRLAHLEESVNRHKTHIGRLEQIIRLLDNDALQPDELARVVNDEIPEYIDNNQEDFDAYEVNTICQ